MIKLEALERDKRQTRCDLCRTNQMLMVNMARRAPTLNWVGTLFPNTSPPSLAKPLLGIVHIDSAGASLATYPRSDMVIELAGF